MSFKSRISTIAVALAGVIAAVGIGVFAARFAANAANSHGAAGAQLYSINPNMYSTASATDAMSADDSSQGQSMLDKAFEKLHAEYYKPVDDKALLKGEHDGLIAYLKTKKVVAVLPEPTVGEPNDVSSDENSANAIFQAAYDKYAAKFGSDDVVSAAISGMLGALGDPYTVYMSQKDTQRFNESIAGGDFGGIGVYIEQDTKSKQTLVIGPIQDTPAAKAGLQPGDLIVSVDGHATKGLPVDAVMGFIRGKQGTTVHLVLSRMSGKSTLTKVVAVQREQIHVPSVAYKMVDGNIGYLQLFIFGETSSDEVAHALDVLNSKGAKAYILDLRNNGGGLLYAAVQISSKFIPDGPIVSTIDRYGHVESENATQDAMPPHPLVVLVNQYSASASEITAGALQDTKIGTLIGVKTYGKGVVQTLYPFSDSSEFKITTARYVTPLGRDINKKGIVPNVVVPMNPQLVGFPGKDVQFNAAVQFIKQQFALNTTGTR
ncbi:MAG TPA: S41 family peptidase [Candidatus Eremiobacteraceae bacterium]|nr:S41 family peptidase [Candidatus Eremiobacteraceae bacterium]